MEKNPTGNSPWLPRLGMSTTAVRTAHLHLVGRYPGWWSNSHRLPKRVFKTLSGCDGSEIAGIRPLTVAGAAQVRLAGDSVSLLLPVELRCVNHTASTNPRILRRSGLRKPYNAQSMANPTHIDQIAERVERLLVRYDELQRTNALLARQVEALTQERDTLKSRLGAARARVDALLDKLPEAAATPKDTP